VIDQEKKYALEKHFQSIYEVEDGVVEEEPPFENPETNKLSEKCLQGALRVYFAYQDGHTEHLEQIF
ncbi:13309_t:CDS:2, partial [Racocetra persica]